MVQYKKYVSPKPAAGCPAFTRGEECGVPCSGVVAEMFISISALSNSCEISYTCSMKQTIVAKLKLRTTSEQFAALRQTQLAYRDALNYVSRYAFQHGKMSNKVRLQDGTYREIRTRFKIPAQMACTIPRQVGATYKGLWTKVKKNAEARKAGLTKKHYKGLDKPPKYVSPTVQYTYERDYTFKSEQHVSLTTLEGRLTLSYQGYHPHVALIQHGARIGD